MTDQKPRTEAGRGLRDAWPQLARTVSDPVHLILAIEAEARAEADARHSQHDYNAGVADGQAQARAEGLDVEVLRAIMHDYEEWAHDHCDHSMFSYYGDDRAGYERNCTLAAQFINAAILAARRDEG